MARAAGAAPSNPQCQTRAPALSMAIAACIATSPASPSAPTSAQVGWGGALHTGPDCSCRLLCAYSLHRTHLAASIHVLQCQPSPAGCARSLLSGVICLALVPAGHGECMNGFCKCHEGYWGHDCAYRYPGTEWTPGEPGCLQASRVVCLPGGLRCSLAPAPTYAICAAAYLRLVAARPGRPGAAAVTGHGCGWPRCPVVPPCFTMHLLLQGW